MIAKRHIQKLYFIILIICLNVILIHVGELEVGHNISWDLLHHHLSVNMLNHHRLVSLATSFSLHQEFLESLHLLVHLGLLFRRSFLLAC